jgi:hypothetical protein
LQEKERNYRGGIQLQHLENVDVQNSPTHIILIYTAQD